LAAGIAAKKKRVVSGMRPTGRLHIGHYFGALQNWVRLQNDPTHECFYFIADWHALTSDYANTSAVAQNTIEITTDYLAAGLDPQQSIIFQQSLVREHAELHLLLSMVTPLGWLERVPTYKEQIDNVKDKDLHTYGFLGYPALQTADIVIYDADLVPVGQDQVAHVELSREIVRRFNYFHSREPLRISPAFYGDPQALEKAAGLLTHDPSLRDRFIRIALSKDPSEFVAVLQRYVAERDSWFMFVESMGPGASYFSYSPTLWEPESQLTETPRIPGLDGRKMSKSYGNAITLSETDEEIRKKTKVMVTDPARKRRSDPGNPDVCPVYDWHRLFSTPGTLEWAAQGCRTAGIGCIECKAKMADHLIEWITPVRERRIEYEKHPARVLELIDEGSQKARVEAQKTMARVREAVFGWEKKRKEVASGEWRGTGDGA
jgi:tryptophanyl-tRNA synthetase